LKFTFHTRLQIIISILVFSILYWLASTLKGFHVDEFYSWVYCQNCSFSEILSLKDTGIGHPPLYHLVQKTIIYLFPSHHYLLVRFANYILGIVFIWIIFKLMKVRGKLSFFLLAFSVSAVMINTFVFSRMWGITCMFAAAVLWQGEEYIRDRKPINLFFLNFFILAGLLSDYSTILIIPYVFLVILSRKNTIKPITYLLIFSLLVLYLFSLFYVASHTDDFYTSLFYNFFKNITQASEQLYVMIFNWGFNEIQYISIFLILGTLLFYNFKKNKTPGTNFVSAYFLLTFVFFILVLLELLIQSDIVRVRSSVLIIFLISIPVLRVIKDFPKHDFQNQTIRIFISIVAAFLILFIVTPFFWENLVDARFLTILLPFMIFLIFKEFPRPILNFLAILLIISGLFFVYSDRIENFYTAPAIKANETTIYQDAGAYATQYLKYESHSGPTPYFLDLSAFQRSCRVCQMGTTDIPFETIRDFYLIGRNKLKYNQYIPVFFNLVSITRPNFTRLDKILSNLFGEDDWDGYQLYYFKRISNYFPDRKK